MTVTVNVALPVLPCESLALQITVVVPSGKVEPGAGAHVTAAIGPSTSSVAVGIAKFATDPAGLFASTWIGVGTFDRIGGVASCTVTVKDPDAGFPCESVAEQLTVVVPSGNEDPDGGVHVTATEPSTRSFALAENVTCVPAGTVMSDGRESVGAVVSFTVTVNVA